MNIHQLLSASQSSPQIPSQGAFSRQDSPNGFFQQALSHASDAQRLSARTLSEADSLQSTPHQAQLSALGGLLSDALEIDIEDLSAALEALGLDINESDLSGLLAQLQQSNPDINLDTLTLDSAQTSTPLDEIAARLTLMASFTEGPPKVQPGSSIDPAVLKAITEHLNINQTEAAQLVSALNSLVTQRQNSQGEQPLPVDTARLTSTSLPAIETQAASRTQPHTFFTQMSTDGAASQISSEALMGALLTSGGVPKGNSSSEHLLTGFTSHAGNPLLASAQPSAQGFAPAVPSTQAALTTPITNPAWPQQLSQQLVQISQRGGEQHVQMQLNPAELGPLSISLKFGEQGAQAHFLSGHAQVRQVLEQAIPQLREALAEQGISLGETSVGDQRDPNAQAFAQSGGKQGAEVGSDSVDLGADEMLSRSAESNPLIVDGRVDLYA
ncbi:hypothetical protein DQ400_17870 [Vreelandella sulfidaeris]|uniref:Flagellar hook-length control protein-like C-terminal domain-containing protein n=1 Tax=Vreelandella sulfidaeris TaxID=115553 RepID=A0A365TLH6_9GAMM|nr:flagellar hook-length control protein FliK [Halomonas sulfidaeris]RBI65488.1 hypothetical protein DQ400_17870 [Halomonas sulfidaeris]